MALGKTQPNNPSLLGCKNCSGAVLIGNCERWEFCKFTVTLFFCILRHQHLVKNNFQATKADRARFPFARCCNHVLKHGVQSYRMATIQRSLQVLLQTMRLWGSIYTHDHQGQHILLREKLPSLVLNCEFCVNWYLVGDLQPFPIQGSHSNWGLNIVLVLCTLRKILLAQCFNPYARGKFKWSI